MKKILFSILIFLIVSIEVFAKSTTVPVSGTNVTFTETRTPSGGYSYVGDYKGSPITITGELGTFNVNYQGANKTINIPPTDFSNPSEVEKALSDVGGQIASAIDSLTSKSNPSAETPDTSSKDNILGISTNKLRNGDITMADIPIMIVSIIEFLLMLAGSISVVALIYHAVRMQLASGITGDSSGVDKAKKGMKGSLLGFVLSMSAWFLMTKFIELLSSST